MAFSKLKQWLFKLNLKVVINMAVFGFVVILIVICTIIQVGLDFTKINWATWAANSLLLIGITMIGQISFEFAQCSEHSATRFCFRLSIDA